MMADPLRHFSNPKIIFQTSYFILLHPDILSLRSQVIISYYLLFMNNFNNMNYQNEF